MKIFFYKNKPLKLSAQIKRSIGYRILICFLLALSVVLAITSIEIASSSQQLEKNIKEQCKTLQSFVISQILIKNEDAIQPKLDSFNQSSSTGKFIWDDKVYSPAQEQLRWQLPFSWYYQYPVKNIDGNNLGTFIVTGSLLEDRMVFNDLLKKITLLLLFFIIIFVVLYPLGRRIPEQLFISPINNLLLLLRNGKKNSITNTLSTLPEEIKEIKNKISTLLKDAEERSHEAALGQIAMQVAHDIRSPLIVLNLETADLLAISENKRLAIRNAIQRVNDIANNLLSQYKKDKIDSTDVIFHPEPIVALLESIISEKRVQVSNTNMRIELEKHPHADNFFANVDIAGFKRVLSNIINNSIEAINNHGLITVKLTSNVSNLVISIIDNGCGIPKDQLPLIIKPGVSFGKMEGNGLGLPYVVDKINSWHGTYTITSEINAGTTFEMTLPQVNPSKWLAANIDIPEDSTVIKQVDLIFIDDDKSITDVWKVKARLSGKNIVVFNDIHDFMNVFTLYEKNIPIYIDSSLGENLKGEDFAKILYERDYKNIFLATGYDKRKFNAIYWVKEIVDKYPPF